MPFVSDNILKIFEIRKRFTPSFVDKFLQDIPNLSNLYSGFKSGEWVTSQLAESQLAECLYVGVRNRVRVRDRG